MAATSHALASSMGVCGGGGDRGGGGEHGGGCGRGAVGGACDCGGGSDVAEAMPAVVQSVVPSDAVGVGLAVREPVPVPLTESDVVCVVENVDVGEWVKVCVGLQVGVHVRE